MFGVVLVALAAMSSCSASRFGYDFGEQRNGVAAAWTEHGQGSGLPMRVLQQTRQADAHESSSVEAACKSYCGSAAIFLDDGGSCQCVRSADECHDLCGSNVVWVMMNGECTCHRGGLAVILAFIVSMLPCCCMCGVVPALVWFCIFKRCRKSGTQVTSSLLSSGGAPMAVATRLPLAETAEANSSQSEQNLWQMEMAAPKQQDSTELGEC